MPAEIDGPAPGRWLLRDQMLRSPTFAQALTKSSCFGAWQEWLRPCQIGRKPLAPADSVPSQAGIDMYGTNVEQFSRMLRAAKSCKLSLMPSAIVTGTC